MALLFVRSYVFVGGGRLGGGGVVGGGGEEIAMCACVGVRVIRRVIRLKRVREAASWFSKAFVKNVSPKLATLCLRFRNIHT